MSRPSRSKIKKRSKSATAGRKRHKKRATVQAKAVSGEVLPARPTPRSVRLNSLVALRREMVKVYRDARSGRIPSSEGTRLAYMLIQTAQIWELAEIEPRLRTIEERMALQTSDNGRPVTELGIPLDHKTH